MGKKEFMDKGFIVACTVAVLEEIREEKGMSIQQISDALPQDYSYIWRKLNGEKGSYEFYESVALALGKSKPWYGQVNIDICQFILNHQQQSLAKRVGNKGLLSSKTRELCRRVFTTLTSPKF